MVMFVSSKLRCVTTPILYYSYCREPTGREYSVPTQTLLVVKLLILAKLDAHMIFVTNKLVLVVPLALLTGTHLLVFVKHLILAGSTSQLLPITQWEHHCAVTTAAL